MDCWYSSNMGKSKKHNSEWKKSDVKSTYYVISCYKIQWETNLIYGVKYRIMATFGVEGEFTE